MLTSENLLKLFHARHSGRHYDATRDVTSAQVMEIIEAGRWAPSCYGEEPWRYIICHKKDHPDAWQKIVDSMVEFNQSWAKNAPVLIVILHAHKFRKNGNNNLWSAYDTGSASYGMMLQATAMGLMAHQMGGFDPSKIKTSFNVNENYSPIALMSIGYESVNPNDKEMARTRQPINEIFKLGKWEN